MILFFIKNNVCFLLKNLYPIKTIHVKNGSDKHYAVNIGYKLLILANKVLIPDTSQSKENGKG